MLNKTFAKLSDLIKTQISKIGALKKHFALSQKTVALFCAVLALTVSCSLLLERKYVTVNDGSSTQRYYSFSASPKGALSGAKLKSENYKIISTSQTDRSLEINLRYVFPVYVTVGSKTHTVDFVSGDTVEKAINLAGITIDEHDSVNLPLTDTLSETTYIDVTDVSFITETYTEKIPYQKTTAYTTTTSYSKVTTLGVDGEMSVTTVTKLVNGEKQSTEITNKTVVKEAVNQVLTIGTRPLNTISNLRGEVPLDENGNPLYYKKHITVQATAYSTGTGTASGKKLEPGCVAVNPDIFPYGTKFYIKSSDGTYIYGIAEARDTGGFVSTRPTNFDLFFNTKDECRAFGRRNIEVWVLE